MKLHYFDSISPILSLLRLLSLEGWQIILELLLLLSHFSHEIEPRSPALQADSLLAEPPGKPNKYIMNICFTLQNNSLLFLLYNEDSKDIQNILSFKNSYSHLMHKKHTIVQRKVQMHTSLLWSLTEAYISKTSIPVFQRCLRPGYHWVWFLFLFS